MKIKPEHYETLKSLCFGVLSAEPDLPAKYAAAGLSEKRTRWDILWRTKSSKWLCDTLYPYANDTHVDTALKAVMRDWVAATK